MAEVDHVSNTKTVDFQTGYSIDHCVMVVLAFKRQWNSADVCSVSTEL
jgi:hypothetical protein